MLFWGLQKAIFEPVALPKLILEAYFLNCKDKSEASVYTQVLHTAILLHFSTKEMLKTKAGAAAEGRRAAPSLLLEV